MQIVIFSMDIVLNKTLNDYLSDQGYTVNCFESFFDLYKALEQVGCETDLLFIDFDMRYLSRSKPILLKKLHLSFPYIPLVGITSISNILPVEKALSCGIYAYLRKPISLSEFDLLISNLNRKIVPV